MSLRRIYAMRNECPVCAAEVGQQCMSRNGRYRKSCHIERHGDAPHKRPRTYVYVIGDPGTFGPVKVGLSSCLSARLASLQTGYPHKLKIHHSYSFASRAAANSFEKRFHAECADEHGMHGEWFGMSPDQAAQIIEGMLPCSRSKR